MLTRIATTCTLVVFFSTCLLAQKQVNIKDSIVSCPLFSVSYSLQMPGGDLAKRFGFNSNLGAHILYKTDKNWLVGGDWNFLFGNRVKESGILDSIATSDGFVISGSGEPADVRVYERGQFASLKIGKIFLPMGPNKNSGFFVLVSPGFLLHKMRIEDIGNVTPQLSKEYRKGYDRLSYGFAMSEMLGYMLLSNNRYLNFFAAFEFTQGFTKNRRGYNYDLNQYDTGRKTDLLNGFRIGFVLPIYRAAPEEFYYD